MGEIPENVAAPRVPDARLPEIRRSRRRVAMLLAEILSLSIVAGLAFTSPAWSQQATATGEVRRLDVQQGTVALRHAEIKALDLPAATLVYHAAPALLKDIKPGDRVRFTATLQDGKYVVTAIEKTMLP